VEDEANRIVWEDRPIAIRFADAAEAAALPLRKESARAGQLRIIEVEDFDVSACGGTHVARTGAVGIIAVTSSERLRGGSRVEFACGGRALRTFRALRDTTAASVRLISVLPNELPGGIERLQADVKDTRRQLKDAQSRLAVYEAAELAGRAVPCGAARLVVEALDGRDQAALKIIATAIATRPGHIAVLFGVPSPAAVVIARSEGTAFDSGAALKRLLQEFGGRGGGRQDLAQGGGLNGTAEALVAFARQLC
jgi:alanyl-tRNA synthetase